MYAGRKDGFLFFSWCGVEVLSTGLDRKFICLLHRIKYKLIIHLTSNMGRAPPCYFKIDHGHFCFLLVFLLNFCNFSAKSSFMGWKAAEKLIRHWKILRGDNVCEPIQTCHMLVFVLFINFTFLFYNFSLIVTHVFI